MNMWLPSPLPRTARATLRDLADGTPAVRVAALDDLGRLYDSPERPSMRTALLAALDDPSPLVRAKAATLAGRVGEVDAADRLLALTDDADPLSRQMAVDGLGALGDPRARACVGRALVDPRPEMRFQAVIAYPRLVDDDEALRALVAATADADREVRYVALRVLEERHGAARPPARLDEAARAAARARLDDDDAGVRVAAAILLGRDDDDAGADVLTAVVDGRVDAAEADDEASAVELVGALRVRDALPALERRAFGPGRLVGERFPLLARVSLAQLGDERAARWVLAELRAWSRRRRTYAVVAAGRARLAAARPLLEAMRDRPERADPDAIDEALRALDQTASGGLMSRDT